jgi:hypothetical protein
MHTKSPFLYSGCQMKKISFLGGWFCIVGWKGILKGVVVVYKAHRLGQARRVGQACKVEQARKMGLPHSSPNIAHSKYSYN